MVLNWMDSLVIVQTSNTGFKIPSNLKNSTNYPTEPDLESNENHRDCARVNVEGGWLQLSYQAVDVHRANSNKGKVKSESVSQGKEK
jgi:hypothetical protein